MREANNKITREDTRHGMDSYIHMDINMTRVLHTLIGQECGNEN